MFEVLFSFRHRMDRFHFLIGLIIQFALVFAINWLFDYYFGSKVLNQFAINSGYLEQHIKFSALSGELKNISSQDSSLLVLLVLNTVKIILSLWIMMALYVKRYRDIGVHWAFIVIAYFVICVVLSLLTRSLYVSITNPINYIIVFGLYVKDLAMNGNGIPIPDIKLIEIPFYICLLFTLFIPLVWRGKKDH